MELGCLQVLSKQFFQIPDMMDLFWLQAKDHRLVQYLLMFFHYSMKTKSNYYFALKSLLIEFTPIKS